MTEYVLYLIIVLAIATLYITYKKGIITFFDRLCFIYLIYVFIHAVYAVLALKVFSFSEVELTGSPFIFGYGPFFFIGLKAITKSKIANRNIFVNCIPLIFFTIGYLVLLSDNVLKSEYFHLFYTLECSVAVISVFVYAFFGMLISQGEKESNKIKDQHIKIGAFSLILMGLSFSVVAVAGILSGKNTEGGIMSLILFSGIGLSIILAFIVMVNNITEKKDIQLPILEEPYKEESTVSNIIAPSKNDSDNDSKDKIGKTPVTTASKYNKSALSPAVLEDYKEKLQRLIHVEKVYLDNELTLEVLAKKIKMPMHHLTQLFNVHLGENFNQYINKYRIGHAKSLLEDNDGMLSIEQIAFNSGFNSKVSFNRHFKILTGYTPKEYASGAGDME